MQTVPRLVDGPPLLPLVACAFLLGVGFVGGRIDVTALGAIVRRLLGR